MPSELFKNKPYTYESDVWSLGACIYEMCNQRHAFEANSINGLALKILKGSYPPVNTRYSKSLRDLINSMMSLKKKDRPKVIEIAQNTFIKKRIIKYLKEIVAPEQLEKTNKDVYNVYLDQAILLGFDLDKEDDQKEEKSAKKQYKSKFQKKKQLAEIVQKRKKEVSDLKKEINNKKVIEEDIKELEAERRQKVRRLKARVATKNGSNKFSQDAHFNEEYSPLSDPQSSFGNKSFNTYSEDKLKIGHKDRVLKLKKQKKIEEQKQYE